MVGGLIGERFIEKQLITGPQLEESLAEQKHTGAMLVEILRRKKFVTDEDAVAVLADHVGVAVCPLRELRVDPEVLALVPEATARRHIVMPVVLDGHTLAVAMANPLDVVAVDQLRLETDRLINVMVATDAEIFEAIDRNYHASDDQVGETDPAGDGALSLQPTARSLQAPSVLMDTESVAPLAEDMSAMKVVDGILERAVQKEATDIHVEPDDKLVRVRIRVDGILQQDATFPKSLQSGLTTRLKIMCSMNITENRLPQDGRALWSFRGKRIDLRASTFPTVYGETIALRLLNRDSLILGLEGLGLAPAPLTALERLIAKPYGIILVTGPTGSGKTTTLYSVLTRLDAPQKNIMTLEDPVEYELPKIRQSPINPQGGLTFAVGLRAILRQDPDIILVGEIRDTETAELTVRSALTGHLVFSTLHTNDAVGAIPRLIDMNMQPFLVASSLLGVLAQRLVRRICTACKTAEPASAATERLIRSHNGSPDHTGAITLARGQGCATCHGTGFKGRVGVFELLTVTDNIRSLIMDRADGRTLHEHAIAEHMTPMFDDGLDKVLQGITTLDEILQATQIEDSAVPTQELTPDG